ncbi:MAG: pentapeptide repeat-containing protein [Rhodothermaceae bacterium]|nr:pentapeptide repeat-containing protein [Rhodothermaceae bacterium]
MTFEDNPGFLILLFIAIVVAMALGLLMLQRWDTFRRLKIALADLQLSSPVIKHLMNSYVDHNCYNTVPHEEFIQVDQPVGEAVDVLTAYLHDDSAEKHCFVFGDPGVGKTAVLVKFMERNLQKRGFNRLDVYAVGMDVPRAYELIDEVEDTYDKIIFIDAYQEEEVLDNHRKRRLMYLMDHCRDFKKVVVFCRYDVVSMGWGKDPNNRQKVVVRNPMRSTDYVFEVIRLQSIPGLLPQFVEDHYGGYGNRKERADFLSYLSTVGPQIRYGFSLPYLPLFKENKEAIQRPIEALEPAIRLQILSFLEGVTPGDIEDTREAIMEDVPGIWFLLAWMSEEAFKTIQIRRQEFSKVQDIKTLEAYLNAVGSDYLTSAELEEIEDRLDMSAVQRVAVRDILFRIENRNYSRLRALRRPKSESQKKREEKREERRLKLEERRQKRLAKQGLPVEALVVEDPQKMKSVARRKWEALWSTSQDVQRYFMFSNRSLMEYLFAKQVIDRIGGLSHMPLTFHMQELLLELTGIQVRLGDRMELINGITARELIDKYANPLDAIESENPNVARFILSNIKQVDVHKYDLRGYMLTQAILRGANMEETLLDGARLDGADLQAANLKKASLRNANLSHARLDGANLEETQASGMYLHEASLRYARMDYAFMSGSWLTGADFSHSVLASGDLESVHVQPDNPKPLMFFETDLRWANLRYSILPGASFERAKLNSADFEQAQLQKASFKHATLVEVNLTLCDLQNADFHGAILEGGHLKRAKLYGANFSEAHLQGANFEHAILHNISFRGVDNSNRLDMREALLEHANMREAEIKFADLKEAQLNFSNMRRIKITNVNLAGASMKKALMEGAELSNVDLKRANLEQAMLNNATMKDAITLDEAVLTGASLLNANLEGRKTTMRKAQLQQAYLYGANLSKVFLLDADLTGCNLERAKLLNTRMVGAKLIRAKLFHSQMNHVELMHANMRYSILCLANMEDAKLNEADMTGADLRDARLLRASMNNTRLDYADCKGALFDKAIMQEAKLTGADMQNCVMKSVNLYGATLVNTNFEGADLRGADLSNAILKGANFMNANLEGADLTDVIIDNTTNFTGANLNGVINFTRAVTDEGRFQ